MEERAGLNRPQPPSIDLPLLTFDATSLRLISWNSSAIPVFPWTTLSTSTTIAFSDLFNLPPTTRSGAGSGEVSLNGDAAELDGLVRECSNTGQDWTWGAQTCTLEVLMGDRSAGQPSSQPCTAVVQRTTDDIFTILLLQPSIAARPPANPLKRASESDPSSTASEKLRVVDRSAKDLRTYLEIAGSVKKPSPDRLEKMVENMAQVCFSLEPSGLATYFNTSWYNYTGLPRTETMDPNVYHPDDHIEIAKQWSQSVATGDPYNMQYRVRSADGTWRWHLAKARKILGPDGDIEFWVGSLTDVDELVKARSDAVMLREHINAVMRSANLVLLSVDRESIITFWEGSTHAEPSSYVGKPLNDLWPHQALHEAVTAVLNGRAGNLLIDWDTKVDGGRIFLRYRLVPLRHLGDEQITGVIVVASDLTDHVEAEEALQRSKAEHSQLLASETAAKEASRLKTEFVTTISHELRTPIAGVIGICEILLDDPTLQGAHRTLIDQALRSGESLLDLVGMVLDLRKIEAGQISLERRPFSVRLLLNDVKNSFAATAVKKGITFNLDIGMDFTGDLIGDHLRFRQICVNGVSNACKFIDKGGTVTVRLRQDSETDSTVGVRVEVQDTGAGIPASVLETLFQPFRQADASTSRQYGGSGLGLVISRQLADVLGGSVNLISTVDGEEHGTTMIIRIPFSKAEVTPPAPASVPVTPSMSSAEKPKATRRAAEDVSVLVAEDNDLLREIVIRTLLKRKFSVFGVGDGREAVKAINERHFDLVVMDIQMPGMDGLDATREIRASTKPTIRDVKVIALTANAIVGDRERCLSAGMNGYLTKPVRGSDLERAIWELLEEP